MLSQYEDIIPGSEAIGFDCNQIIPANGAIHCIAMKVPAMKEMISCGNNIGDVNLDQRINIFDILRLVDIVMGFVEPELCSIEAGDLNTDNQITIIDVIELVYLVMDL